MHRCTIIFVDDDREMKVFAFDKANFLRFEINKLIIEVRSKSREIKKRKNGFTSLFHEFFIKNEIVSIEIAVPNPFFVIFNF